MDCSSPGSSVHGIPQARIWIELPFPSPGYLPDPGIEPGSLALQARILELVAMLSFRDLPDLGSEPASLNVFCIGRNVLYH